GVKGRPQKNGEPVASKVDLNAVNMEVWTCEHARNMYMYLNQKRSTGLLKGVKE
ncbi:unnamed protein product, partial [Sphenostylis stenocarpa]